MDGPGNKTLENGFEITSQGANASMVVAEKGFDINDGVVTIYRGDLVIDGDDITIGYTSGSQHALQILNAESLSKLSKISNCCFLVAFPQTKISSSILKQPTHMSV